MRLAAVTLAVVIVLIPASASSRCFSVWHYPWAQRCGAARHMARVTKPLRVRHEAPFVSEKPSIPLPSLARADLDGGAADEPTRARLLLRAALETAR